MSLENEIKDIQFYVGLKVLHQFFNKNKDYKNKDFYNKGKDKLIRKRQSLENLIKS